MAQPTTYNRSFSFTNHQASNPSDPLPGDSLDGELNDVKTTSDQTLANLALIQSDDGTLKNGIVGVDQISSEVEIGFTVPTAWQTATAYVSSPASTVFYAGIFYRCAISHTSGTFATDLAAVKWVQIADLTAIPVGTAAQIAYTPAGSISSSNVQAALTELDTEKAALSHTHTSTAISDSTTIGRTLLTAANAAAIRAALGVPASSAVQAADDTLTALAGVAAAANKLIYFTGVDVATVADFTAFARTLLDDADAAAFRTTLGLADSAIIATGTTGTAIPRLNGANTWGDTQTFSKAPKLASVARCTAAFSKVNNTLADITGMSLTIETGKKYRLHSRCSYNGGAGVGGGKFALGGTATLATLQAACTQVSTGDRNETSIAAALGTAFTGMATNSQGVADIHAYIDCTTGGTITIQFAQQTTNATAAIVDISSYMEVVEIS